MSRGSNDCRSLQGCFDGVKLGMGEKCVVAVVAGALRVSGVSYIIDFCDQSRTSYLAADIAGAPRP